MVAESEMNDLEEMLSCILAMEAENTKTASRLERETAELRRSQAKIEDLKASATKLLEFRGTFQAAKPIEGVAVLVQARRYDTMGLIDAVSTAVKEIAKHKELFSSVDVIQHFNAIPEPWKPQFNIKKNRANISAAMSNLESKGVLSLVTPHSGRRAAIFRRRLNGGDQNQI